MRFHPLGPEVKCPGCGGELAFVRVRGHGDLYHCASGRPCVCVVIHYRMKGSLTCGYAVTHNYGAMGRWTDCGAPPKTRRQ